MTPLDLHSEKFARTGNIAGQGFRRLLGRPALGLLQTVIREALQNSVDAASGENGIEILLRYRTLQTGQLSKLRNVFFNRMPPDEAEEASGGNGCESLRKLLNEEKLSLLEIADFGTSGLGGPTRADIADGGVLDFVNFLRNVGAARDTHHGGGTYGYGKTSLYALSRVSTIIVDSQTTDAGRPVRRLMGCQLGNVYQSKRHRFTGRHWWGRGDAGGVEPVVGADAVRLSKLLGLPDRDRRKTGTTIAVLAPHIDMAEDLRAELTETVLWNFWPLMCSHTPRARKLQVRLEVQGEECEVPEPESYPPLDLYAAALSNIRGGGDGQVTTIRCAKPAADLGRLSIVKGLRAKRSPMALRESSPMREQAHSIALMRPVELVVRYLTGEAFADKRFEWGGVFVCSSDNDVEEAFAVSEPPAHDDWMPDMLPRGRAKTFVNVALRELKVAAATYAQPKPPIGPGGGGPSVAVAAAKLGSLLSVPRKGRPEPTAPKGGSPKKKITISAPRFISLAHSDGRRIATFAADLENDGSHPDMLLRASPFLVMDGSSTTTDDLPDDVAATIVDLSVGNRVVAGQTMNLQRSEGLVYCRVTVPDDAPVGVRFSFEEGEAA